jgi:thiosulfate reductase cytochrome b subunit
MAGETGGDTANAAAAGEIGDPATPSGVSGPRRVLIRRHSVAVRVTHWVNVVCLTILLMSGLQIFNAHPALYIGNDSDFDHPVLAINAERQEGTPPRGVTTVLGYRMDTTGVLGVSHDRAGNAVMHAFPPWATLPSWYSLADGRQWHFLFAWLFVLNGLVYLLHGFLTRHVWRDLVPSLHELRGAGRVFWDHLRFRYPEGDEARRYNVLQKLAYLLIVLLALPLMLLTGLTMSPRLNAAVPELLAVFGGRQSARTIHFAVAVLLVGFVVLHVGMVVASGAWNNMRSMVSGRYAIRFRREGAHR